MPLGVSLAARLQRFDDRIARDSLPAPENGEVRSHSFATMFNMVASALLVLRPSTLVSGGGLVALVQAGLMCTGLVLLDSHYTFHKSLSFGKQSHNTFNHDMRSPSTSWAIREVSLTAACVSWVAVLLLKDYDPAGLQYWPVLGDLLGPYWTSGSVVLGGVYVAVLVIVSITQDLTVVNLVSRSHCTSLYDQQSSMTSRLSNAAFEGSR